MDAVTKDTNAHYAAAFSREAEYQSPEDWQIANKAEALVPSDWNEVDYAADVDDFVREELAMLVAAAIAYAKGKDKDADDLRQAANRLLTAVAANYMDAAEDVINSENM